MNLLMIGLPVAILMLSNSFANAAMFNGVLQLIIFIFTANIPALVTGRMSYVDIAWPWGLVTIGIIPFFAQSALEHGLRTKLVMLAYAIAGGRMALGGLRLFFAGHLKQEFPRYLYLRRIWAKKRHH